MSSASIKFNLKPNFLKMYLSNPYDIMFEILFKTNLFFSYLKILLRSFSFWDIENVKPKFQPRYAYKHIGMKFGIHILLIKKECLKREKR